MEMAMSGGAGAVPKQLELDDDPAAAAAVAAEPWSPERKEKKKMWRQVLLVGSLVTLPLLLAFFVLGQPNASSAAWLQLAIAKLTTTNNNNGAGGRDDELLGGLLPPDMDRRSCRSRYESSQYYKHFPFSPSPYLKRKLRAYEARHRRCAPGTPLYAAAVEHLRRRSGDVGGGTDRTETEEEEECRYVVWLPFDGLGNRMLSMVSGFLYALLTGRVFLVALPPDSADLFCEPFPNATWQLPVHDDFPVPNLFSVGQDMDRSYTKLLAGNNGMTAANTTIPAYVYLSLGWEMRDGVFFCGEHQRVLGKIDWLLLYSDLYFAPSLYAVTGGEFFFRDELRRMFPAAALESVHHLLARYLLHPANPVWGMVTAYYRSHLATASRRVGVQVRMFGHSSIPADVMYHQILNCSRQEHILPETTDDDGNNNSTAIFIASLYGDYYKRLRSRYSGDGGAARVEVFQRTHEERQDTGRLEHNQRALAEIYLLSFCDELITSGLSTFGYVSSGLAGVRPAILLTAFDHKVPETPCRRAVSMEPCNLTPPRGVQCREKPGGDDEEEDVARHVRVCEDFKDGVKFFD